MSVISVQELTNEYLSETIEMATRAFGTDTARQNAEIDFPTSISKQERPHKTLIALDKGKVVGATQVIHGNLSVDIYNILWVCVDPKHQNQGIGRIILNKASQYIEEKLLEGKPGTIILVSDINISYYEKSGFENKSNTHSDGTIMRKIIKGK